VGRLHFVLLHGTLHCAWEVIAGVLGAGRVIPTNSWTILLDLHGKTIRRMIQTLRVTFYLSVGELKHTVELPNGLSEQEIEAEFQEWKNDHLDQSWWFEEKITMWGKRVAVEMKVIGVECFPLWLL